MISYELAKELKDAGFPQAGMGSWIIGDNSSQGSVVATTCYRPTLSELIEACGDELDTMFHYGTEWRVGSFDGYQQDWVGKTGEPSVGSTPEEAVARLWLAINKKYERQNSVGH